MALVFFLLAGVARGAQQNSFQIIDGGSLPALSRDCTAALTQNITCNFIETGSSLYRQTNDLTTQDLDRICTSECADSIASYKANVNDACEHDIYNDTSNATQYQYASEGAYSPVVIPEYYFTNYKQRCTKNSSGSYCYQHLWNTNTQDECDECNLMMFQAELENGYFYNEGLASDYASLTSSCGVTNLPVTSPPSVVIASNSVASPTPTCVGRMVEISSGCTCDSVAAANNISTWQLLSVNGLNGGCVNFPESGSLCISGNCQSYTVLPDDNCLKIVHKFGMTITQLRRWNPNLSSDCGNFDTVVGHQICVSNPSNFSLPTNTKALSPIVAVSVPTDVADGTNIRCGQYYHVNKGDTCAYITVAKAISLRDFLLLNPALDDTCTNLLSNRSYCVEPVGDIASYPGQHSDWMESLMAIKITGAPTRLDLLPNATMPTLHIRPTQAHRFPLASGTRGDCERYADNSHGAVSCDAINPGVSPLVLTSWNPALSPYNCRLVNETSYCIVPGSSYVFGDSVDSTVYDLIPTSAAKNYTSSTASKAHTSPTTTNSVTTTTSEIPIIADQATTQTCATSSKSTHAGIPSDCSRYLQQTSGKRCSDLAADAGITLDEFYKLNTSVGTSCQHLVVGDYYCVATSSAANTTNPTKATISTHATGQGSINRYSNVFLLSLQAGIVGISPLMLV